MARLRANRNHSHTTDWASTPAEEAKILEIREFYRRNPRAFLEECFSIIDRDNPSELAVIKLKPNAGQDAFLRLRDEIRELNLWRSTELRKRYPEAPITELPINIVVVKPRKIGISTIVRGLNNWKCEFYPHTNSVLLGHDAEALKSQILTIDQRYQDFFDNPYEVNWRIPLHRSSDNLIEWGEDPVTGRAHDSRVIVKTAGVTAKQSARGGSSSFSHVTELAHFKSNSEFSGLITSRLVASETYVESTANGMGGLFFNLVAKARTIEEVKKATYDFEPLPGWNNFVLFFWSWLDDPNYRQRISDIEKRHLLQTLSAEEQELLDRFKATPEQLAWRRNKIEVDGNAQTELDPADYFHQEFPTELRDAFVARGENVFNPKILFELEEQAPVPVWTGLAKVKTDEHSDSVTILERPGATELEVFDEVIEGEDYVIGVDTAEGRKDGDFTVISVFWRIDVDAITEAARYIGKANTDEAALITAHLAAHYNDAFIIPEANFPGNATCLTLYRLDCPNMYFREAEEKVSDENLKALYLGFKTTPQTKPLIVSEAIRHLRQRGVVLKSKEAIRQWSFYKNEDGKYSAPPGDHDDCVSADMLAIWAHFTGKCPPLRKYQEDAIARTPNDLMWNSIDAHIRKSTKKPLAYYRKPFIVRPYR